MCAALSQFVPQLCQDRSDASSNTSTNARSLWDTENDDGNGMSGKESHRSFGSNVVAVDGMKSVTMVINTKLDLARSIVLKLVRVRRGAR